MDQILRAWITLSTFLTSGSFSPTNRVAQRLLLRVARGA
jgi:hypothetical protein